MKKLVLGIIEFRKKILPGYRETFARLALEQKPDTLFIACSDSRVVPNLFASTDPGDLFVIRNVGNLIPPCGNQSVTESDESELAALEIALFDLKVKDIVICGHSECAAMHALVRGREKVSAPHLKNWLRHGDGAYDRLKTIPSEERHLSDANHVSQLNVLLQIENLMSYPMVASRVKEGSLRIHAWWFDIGNADVYWYDPIQKSFAMIDEEAARHLLEQASHLS